MKQMTRDSQHFEHLFQQQMLRKLWEPVTIGTLLLKNRIAMAPVQRLLPEITWPEMHPTHIAFHEAVARGGAGLIVVGEVAVTPDSPGTLQKAAGERRPPKAIWSDETIPGWVQLIEACHKWDAKVVLQLSTHAPWVARVAGVRGEGVTELVVPSWKDIGMTPAVLEAEIEHYVAAAIRAKKAGADGVQLTAARESLIAILTSRTRNPGVPGYSEGMAERLRFPVDCIRRIKSACGKDFPVMIRISAVEYIKDGNDIEYTRQAARTYADAGVDCIDVVQAGFSTQVPQLQMTVPPGAFAHYARTVKSDLASLGSPYNRVVIMNACRIQNPWLAASLLRNGDCDIVSVCRQLIADPDWPNKIKDGHLDDIVPCTGCVWCMGSFTCAVNPQSPYYKSPETMASLKITRAVKQKKALVAGGGLAGMEAAVTLAMRGHQVTLYEKEAVLGRRLYIQSLAPFRTDMDLLRKYLVNRIEKQGVAVRYNQEVTAALVEQEKPDVVIVATGCRPVMPDIPGIQKHAHVVFAEDVLLEKVDVGKKIVVIDADYGHDLGALGSFTAQFVARAACVRDDVAMHIMRWNPQHDPAAVYTMSNTPVGREVTVVSSDERIADIFYHHYTTTEDLRRMGVRVIKECQYREINEKGLILVSGGKQEFLAADTIITANYEPAARLYRELEGKFPELFLIGDAKAVQVQYIANIHGPYRLALTI
jgi:2,4-dienoyl-CoA reductase-like NADH-dependent reductase (Old Yellow Enzyme family)